MTATAEPVAHYVAAYADYTLCGDAFDLCKLDDADAETPVFAKPGQLVTCPKCRSTIDDIRRGLTQGYRVRKASDDSQE